MIPGLEATKIPATRRSKIWLGLGFAAQALLQLGFLLVYWSTYEAGGLIVHQPSPWHRAVAGASLLTLLVGAGLLLLRLRGYRPSRPVVAAMAVLTAGVLAAGLALLIGAALTPEEPFRILVRSSAWLGAPVESYYQLNPLGAYCLDWLAFASWVIGLVAAGPRSVSWRRRFLIAAWVAWVPIAVLVWSLGPVPYRG